MSESGVDLDFDILSPDGFDTQDDSEIFYELKSKALPRWVFTRKFVFFQDVKWHRSPILCYSKHPEVFLIEYNSESLNVDRLRLLKFHATQLQSSKYFQKYLLVLGLSVMVYCTK